MGGETVRLRLRGPGGQQAWTGPADTTIGALRAAVECERLGLAAGFEFLVGFPPATVSAADGDAIGGCFASGDTVTVRAASAPQKSAVNFEPAAPPAKVARTAPAAAPPAAEERIVRRVMPADNSCLFHALGYALEGGRVRVPSYAQTLRAAVGTAVLGSPDTWDEAVLGRSPRAYAEWIRSSEHWGGAIEIAILSEHYAVEIAAFDCATQRVDTYGQGRGYTSRVLLVYDGIHYDLLVRELFSGAPEDLDISAFEVDDDLAMAQAAELVAVAHREKKYTDTSSFTVRCLVCQKGLAGEKEALAHAKATGHTNFSEFHAAS